MGHVLAFCFSFNRFSSSVFGDAVSTQKNLCTALVKGLICSKVKRVRGQSVGRIKNFDYR